MTLMSLYESGQDDGVYVSMNGIQAFASVQNGQNLDLLSWRNRLSDSHAQAGAMTTLRTCASSGPPFGFDI